MSEQGPELLLEYLAMDRAAPATTTTHHGSSRSVQSRTSSTAIRHGDERNRNKELRNDKDGRWNKRLFKLINEKMKMN